MGLHCRFLVLFTGLLCFIATHAHAAVDADTIQYTGVSNNRVDIVFFADGWGESQEAEMKEELQAHIDRFFEVPTFGRYRNFFNVYIANHYRPAPSGGVNESYARDHYGYYSDACTEAVPAVEVRYVVCNGSGWGQYYQANLGMVSNDDDDIIGTHELSHGWNVLADTYDGMSGDWLPNRTTDPSGAWDHWLGYTEPYNGDVVGVYPVEQANSYRSIENPYTLMGHCRHRTRVIDYTPVERESVIMDIYEYVDPLDDWTPNSTVLQDPETIEVAVVDPRVIKVDWYVDDELVVEEGKQTFIISNHIHQTGTYTVKAHMYDYGTKVAFSDRGGDSDGVPGSADPDSLDWIRSGFDSVQQEMNWNLNITKLPVRTAEGAVNNLPMAIKNITAEEIHLDLPGGGGYALDIFTVEGQKIDRITSGHSGISRVRVHWDGNVYRSKLYLLRLSSGEFRTWRKWMAPK